MRVQVGYEEAKKIPNFLYEWDGWKNLFYFFCFETFFCVRPYGTCKIEE